MNRRVFLTWCLLAALLAWLLAGAVLVALNPGTGAPHQRAEMFTSPAQAGPLVLIAVGNDRYAWITRRRDDAPIGATPEFVGAIYGEQAGGWRFENGWTYIVDVPGPTATIWPTIEPDTATPTGIPTGTFTPVPTAAATETATSTPTGTPAGTFLPVVMRPRARR